MDQPHSLSPCNGTESVYASLDVLEPAFIVLAVPILYKGIYPLWNTSWICCHWTLLRRLGLGIILAVVASACAAIVEVARRASSEHPEMCLSPGGHSIFKRAHMSLLWQIPQYCMYSLSKGLLIMSGEQTRCHHESLVTASACSTCIKCIIITILNICMHRFQLKLGHIVRPIRDQNFC